MQSLPSSSRKISTGTYSLQKPAKSGGEKGTTEKAKLDEAFKGAARIVEATYEFPFQSHASFTPGIAVVDFQPNAITTLWTGSQKPHYAADGVANILGLKSEQVRGIWVPGAGCYGRNDAGDAAVGAAILSKAVGKPVRYQMMRHEGTGWDPSLLLPCIPCALVSTRTTRSWLGTSIRNRSTVLMCIRTRATRPTICSAR